MASLERQLIRAEIIQRREEGCAVDDVAERIKAALDTDKDGSELVQLYDELMALPIDDAFPYDEPSTLAEIRAARPDTSHKLESTLDDDALYDRIYGAWLGRAAGCALGKPVEGWPKERIDKYLTKTNALPLDNYLPYDEKIIPRTLRSSTRGNIEFMDRDDDLDFPILGLVALESKGAKLNARTMANTWLHYMPYGLVYTAENSAYRNFVQGIYPPESAEYRNPFREWIGAQIRADIFGYAAPAWPERAAELAFYDASISHTKNGIYGEMFVAAMIAAAFVYDDVDDIVAAGLGEIPEKCRLAECIKDTQEWCRQEEDWEAAWAKIFEHYGKYHGVHTINNAALVVMGLYYGIEDFEKGIVVTVRGGWDTDCTGATVGSILGAKMGAKALPDKWIGVLNDRLKSAVRDHNDNKFSDLAARTMAVAKDISAAPEMEEEVVKSATLTGTAGGVWELETGWGRQRLDLTKGIIEFIDDEFGPYIVSDSSYSHPELKFTFAVDKGGWDFEISFEGKVSEDALEGAYFPMDTPVSGKRSANT
jgi:ADP-ribosylglycohydrolase